MGGNSAKRNRDFTSWLQERADAGRELPLAHIAALATLAAGPVSTSPATLDNIAELLANHDAGHHAMPPPLPRNSNLAFELGAFRSLGHVEPSTVDGIEIWVGTSNAGRHGIYHSSSHGKTEVLAAYLNAFLRAR